MPSHLIHRQLILSLYSLTLPSRLDSLTLAVAKWFTSGLYFKLKYRLQTHIIKYILSKKLNNKISLIMKRIRTAQYLTDYEIREYMFLHEAPSQEELLLRFFRNEKINYNDLVLVNSILKFNEKFLELYKDYYYNGRLPSHSNYKYRLPSNSNYKNREYIMEKKYYIPDTQIIYRIPLITNFESSVLISPKKKKEKKNFPPQKEVWYNQRR